MVLMYGENIDINGDGRYRGYLSISKGGTGPGVIVLQEWWGLVGHIKEVADRFAEAGFTALAPDLYHGESAVEPEEAGKLMMALNIEETELILRKTIESLMKHPAVAGLKVGVVGFCMGGQLSMFAACSNPNIGACVNFYGIHPNVHPNFGNLNGPVLGFFAEHDAYAGPEQVKVLDKALTNADKEHEFHIFAGRHHAFFNNERPAFEKKAADEAWTRMIDFFRQNLE